MKPDQSRCVALLVTLDFHKALVQTFVTDFFSRKSFVILTGSHPFSLPNYDRLV